MKKRGIIILKKLGVLIVINEFKRFNNKGNLSKKDLVKVLRIIFIYLFICELKM